MRLKRRTVAEAACRAIRDVARDEEGVAAIEYALLASLIAVVAAAGIATLGERVKEMWDAISEAVSDALQQ